MTLGRLGLASAQVMQARRTRSGNGAFTIRWGSYGGRSAWDVVIARALYRGADRAQRPPLRASPWPGFLPVTGYSARPVSERGRQNLDASQRRRCHSGDAGHWSFRSRPGRPPPPTGPTDLAQCGAWLGSVAELLRGACGQLAWRHRDWEKGGYR